MISVIVPNYNHAPYLKQRIDSVLNQTYQDFELIILDDCSTDNSIEIIEQYRNHPKVSHIIYNTENSGSTFKQWNKGVRLAKGKYIWIAESDDVAEPNFLVTLVKNLERNNSIVLAYCQSTKMDSYGKTTGNWLSHTESLPQRFNENFICNGEKFIKNNLIVKNVIPNASAVVFKKEIFDKVNEADEDIRFNSDWLLWLKMLLWGNVFFSKDSFNNFRYHQNSVIASAIKTTAMPFIKRYDILMMQRYLIYLCKYDKKELASLFKEKISADSEIEFRFLYNVKQTKEGSKFFIKGFSYSNNKIVYIFCNLKFILKTFKVCFR
jgi:glycosyltransferase involved in cell wall biosynthesis